MDKVMVYMTASDEAEALAVGRVLVKARLAACVNVLGPVKSIYEWDGEVREEAETAFIAKTTADRVDELAAMVAGMHSYDTPCVAAMPISGGYKDFLDWIGNQVRSV